jgi:3-hydroxyacyl-CoA dehydrogenase
LPNRWATARLHFFNPVRAMPPVEIVVGASTPPGAVDTARAVVARLGKDPGFYRWVDGVKQAP